MDKIEREDWNKLSFYILEELKRLNVNLENLEKKLSIGLKDTDEKIQQNMVEIAIIRTKVALYSGGIALVVSLVMSVLMDKI